MLVEVLLLEMQYLQHILCLSNRSLISLQMMKNTILNNAVPILAVMYVATCFSQVSP